MEVIVLYNTKNSYIVSKTIHKLNDLILAASSGIRIFDGCAAVYELNGVWFGIALKVNDEATFVEVKKFFEANNCSKAFVEVATDSYMINWFEKNGGTLYSMAGIDDGAAFAYKLFNEEV